MAITKQYLDLNGLKYVLEQLTSTSTGTGIVSEVSQKNGIVNVTKRALGTSDIPALAYLSGASLSATKADNTTTFTSTFTKGAGASDTTTFGITTTGALTSALTGNVLTLGYTPKATTNNYITIGSDNSIGLDSTKLAGKGESSKGDTTIALKGYVDEKVQEAIKGGVVYKGTADKLPEGPINGDMYKVTTQFTITGVGTAKVGDIIIYNGNGETPHWDIIPAGDDIEFTGIKVGETYVIDPSKGGDAEFKAGEGLSVTGAPGVVTYSHSIPTGASAKTSGLYKFSTDKFGHVNGTTAVATADLTALLDDSYMAKTTKVVNSLGGQSGALTLKAANTTDKGSVNLAISTTGELSASIYGLGSAAYTDSSAYATKSHTHAISDITDLQTTLEGKQAKFTDGSATITTATPTAEYTAYKTASTAETIKFRSVSQTGGKIGNGTEENVISNITFAQIDDLFKNA